MPRLALINRFYPPDPAVTGRAADELVAYLLEHVPELQVRIFASAAGYCGGMSEERGTRLPVERIPTAQMRQNGVVRFLMSLWDGYRLVAAASRWKPDVIISLTDPPLLGFWIGRRRTMMHSQVRWIEWTMDLYPEAYARLIEAFRERTGVPIVLNTSFNENEPVVCRPQEAIDCFLRTKMDLLVLDGIVIDRGSGRRDHWSAWSK